MYVLIMALLGGGGGGEGPFRKGELSPHAPPIKKSMHCGTAINFVKSTLDFVEV